MRERGFSVNRLRTLAASFAEVGCNAELVMISDALPEELRTDNEAATLVLRTRCHSTVFVRVSLSDNSLVSLPVFDSFWGDFPVRFFMSVSVGIFVSLSQCSLALSVLWFFLPVHLCSTLVVIRTRSSQRIRVDSRYPAKSQVCLPLVAHRIFRLSESEGTK